LPTQLVKALWADDTSHLRLQAGPQFLPKRAGQSDGQGGESTVDIGLRLLYLVGKAVILRKELVRGECTVFPQVGSAGLESVLAVPGEVDRTGPERLITWEAQ